MNKQALFKNIPEQSTPGKSDFSLQINAVDQWFDSLPMANIRVSTKSIYKALKETNQQKSNYKKRLYFLEKIHAPITELASNLKKMNLNRELPLDEKHHRIALLLQKLHRQITIAYKCVLRDLLSCKLFFLCPGKRKTMTLVIARIIRHHSLSLIAHYQFYNAPSKTQWSEIHQLFLLAHKEKLLNKKVPDSSFQLISESTIKHIYLQILLIAIADPYRMAQHHIYAIFKQLEEWAPLADIQLNIEQSAKDALAVDLSSNRHPSFVALQDITNKKNIAILDTSQLDYAHLFELFNGPETQTTEISADLLKQLSLFWGVAPNRQHSRRPAKSKLKVAIGLNNVHYVLNGYAPPDWMQSSEADGVHTLELSDNSFTNNNFSARTVDTTEKVSDIWGEVFQNQSLSDAKVKGDMLQPASVNSNPNAPQEWSMVNESIGGYCLLWQHHRSINAKVGELIAISHETQQKEGYWFVGTIRWMKCLNADNVQIGIQIIAPNAIAVSTAKFVSMQEGMKSRAILLPAIPILKQPKTLVTTALGYETRDQVILDEYRLIHANITSVKSKVVLLDTLETSSHFARFKYTLAEEFYNKSVKKNDAKKSTHDTLSLSNDTDFDSIWDDL